VKVKSLSDTDGTYCRQVPLRSGGSTIGPGIRRMAIKNAENGNIAPARTDYLSAEVIPRCLNMGMRGSHMAIWVADQELDQADPTRVFAYYPEKDLSDDAHCVYKTLKPRCVDFTKPAGAFQKLKRTQCRIDAYSPTCFDQCYSIHCPAEDTMKDHCGKSKAFQDCATCCDNNDNVASGCFRRRRRLGANMGPSGDAKYKDSECAAACLNWVDPQPCIGYYLDEGACFLTTYCDNAPRDKMSAEQAEHGDWERGTWQILSSLEAEDLSTLPIKDVKRKRKRKNKAGTEVATKVVKGTAAAAEEAALLALENEAYDPCEGRDEGDICHMCAEYDFDCMESADVKTCQPTAVPEDPKQWTTVWSSGGFGGGWLGRSYKGADFDKTYAETPNALIIRECLDCPKSHQMIVYKRLSKPSEFVPKKYFLDTWSSKNNRMHKDFALYSSVEDALADENRWRYCNYNDRGIGFPRDCGPNRYHPYTWTSASRAWWASRRHVRYSIVQADVSSANLACQTDLPRPKPYDACANKKEGDVCTFCGPEDKYCSEPTVAFKKMSDKDAASSTAAGDCSGYCMAT
jgi:hypothetical protein